MTLSANPSQPGHSRWAGWTSLSALVRLSGALAATLILAVTAADISFRRSNTLDEGERRMHDVSLMLTEQVARSFEAVDRALLAAADAYAAYQGHAGPPADPYEILRAIEQDSPVLTGLAWVDAAGVRTHSSVNRTPPPLVIADQEQFTVHRDSPNAGFFLSHPFQSVLDRQWIVIASRRVNGPDGGFAGIVQAGVAIDYFDRIYAPLHASEGITIALYRTDGAVLIRTPSTYDFIGRVLRGPLFPAITKGAGGGLIHGINALDGPQGPVRIAAYNAVPGLPLIAFASIAEDRILERWWRSVELLVPTAVVFAILILAGASMLARQIAYTEKQQRALAAANAAAQEAQEDAVQANQAKSAFLARMTHELRTPLNAVIGFAQMLLLEDSRLAPEKKREYVSLILGSGEHLLGLVNEVLDLASIEAGKLKLSLEPVKPQQTVQTICETMMPAAQRAHITLTTEASADLPDVRADEQRLREVLLNLISNAIKYNRPRGSVTVTVSAAVPGRVLFAVTDTGPGIPPERQAELFQPFERLGAADKATEGTGLGLAITKRLVEAMNGTIGFDSGPDGTRFWVELPAAD